MLNAPAPATGRSEIAALTGLRAWAALWVVAHHHRVFVEGELGEPWMGLLDRGYLGVDLFFTLSGFVLAYNYADRVRNFAEYARFVALRIARLYPLHLATLAIVLVVSASAPWTGLRIGSPGQYELDHHLALHLLMLHGWGFETGLRFNRVSWSISAELFAYLWFPLFWAFVVRFRSALAAAAGSFIAAGATIVVLRALGHHTLHVPTEHALVRVAGEFLAGCFLYRLYALSGGGPIPPRATGLGVAAVALLAMTPAAEPWLALAARLLVGLLAAGRGPGLAAFTARPVVFLGRISYSIYLTHMMVLSALQRVIPTWSLGELGPAGTLAVLAVHAVATVGFAALCYAMIEWPARNALRRRILA